MEEQETTSTQVAASEPVETTSATETTSSTVETGDGKVDWWNPDTWGKTPPKEIVSKIQTQYNDVATKAKTLERDYQTTQQEMEKIVTDVKRALSDENYYREQRRALGYEVAPREKNPELDFSKMETVGDVVNAFQGMKNHFETRLQEVERNSVQRAETQIRQAVDPISRERWSVAIENMKSKYGDAWSKVDKRVVRAIMNGEYAYKPGAEKEILDKVFRAECPDEYEATVIENLKKRSQEKAKATTVSPRSAVPRTKPGGTSTEDIIARVNARLGANSLHR